LDHKQVAPKLYPNQQKHYAETRRGHVHHKRFSLNRLDWNGVAPTVLKTPGSGGHMHPDEPRLLNTGELQRVASFPDGFKFAGDWNATVNRIGNSVPPLFMRAIARHVRSTILEASADV
jgi:DNA (cytosine-5)-methyltransferase 1